MGKSSVKNSEKELGFPSENAPHDPLPGTTMERPQRPAWIPDALLAETVKVWSKAYGRRISEKEAIEILTNVKRLGEALLQAKRERH
jgi:hypothetical protein